MPCGFISDLHLSDADQPLASILSRFLAGPARDCSRLFVLGDLFETWVGDDDDSALARSVAHGFADLAASGTRVYFQHGNRDFLIGRGFAERAHLHLLPDPCVVEIAGRPVLLSHGDRYCVDDAPYQAFRRQVRDPDWQRDFLSLPLVERQSYAHEARVRSAAHQQGRAEEIGDVNAGCVDQELQLFGVALLIHGHTHRPATHRHLIGTGCVERWVLADWRTHGEVLMLPDDGSIVRRPLD